MNQPLSEECTIAALSLRRFELPPTEMSLPLMALPYELLIGLRYTRAKRRNHFISFISLISMLGIGSACRRADRRAVGDERLPDRAAHAHSGVASHIQITGINGELR
jgi:lipoprotein-releasing system permease protein